MLSEAFLGTVLGGALRIAPEVLRSFNERSERKHELAMQEHHLKYVKEVGPGRAEDFGPPPTATEMQALGELYIAKATARSPRWVSLLAALVRPSVTFALVLVYIVMLLVRGEYGPEDMSLLSSVVSFWFTGRVWDRLK